MLSLLSIVSEYYRLETKLAANRLVEIVSENHL
jgi:hypothetical protein